jgi:XTP/dITP diphosphohydrolase
MHLHLATTNPGKLRDFAHALTPGYTLEPLPNISAIEAPEETADTFEGNARLKALAYSHHAPDLYILADDSGLEVAALHGAPGVRSARYAEDVAFPSTAPSHSPLNPDERNNLALLHALAGQESPGHYRCVLALARNGEILATTSGAVEGRVLTAPRGTAGFGYDPLFFIPETHQTMAELDPQTRLHYSHRGRALTKLLALLSAR